MATGTSLRPSVSRIANPAGEGSGPPPPPPPGGTGAQRPPNQCRRHRPNRDKEGEGSGPPPPPNKERTCDNDPPRYGGAYPPKGYEQARECSLAAS